MKALESNLETSNISSCTTGKPILNVMLRGANTLTCIAQSARVGVAVLRIKLHTHFLAGAVAKFGALRVR